MRRNGGLSKPRRPTDAAYGPTALVVSPFVHHSVRDPNARVPQRLKVDPSDNIIVGAQDICNYLGISSIVTMWRWVEFYGLPCIKRPDGVWMTSMTAIDEWIFLAADIVADKTAQHREAAKRAARGVGITPGRVEPRKPYRGKSDDQSNDSQP